MFVYDHFDPMCGTGGEGGMLSAHNAALRQYIVDNHDMDTLAFHGIADGLRGILRLISESGARERRCRELLLLVLVAFLFLFLAMLVVLVIIAGPFAVFARL